MNCDNKKILLIAMPFAGTNIPSIQLAVLEGYLKEYCQDLNMDINKVTKKRFIKLLPVSSRPYGNLYDY